MAAREHGDEPDQCARPRPNQPAAARWRNPGETGVASNPPTKNQSETWTNDMASDLQLNLTIKADGANPRAGPALGPARTASPECPSPPPRPARPEAEAGPIPKRARRRTETAPANPANEGKRTSTWPTLRQAQGERGGQGERGAPAARARGGDSDPVKTSASRSPACPAGHTTAAPETRYRCQWRRLRTARGSDGSR